ncbi:MAG: metallophosphoesterase family protein [Nitrososphaerales archaeon]
MMLVQLSDIHVGPQFRKEVFEKAVEEVNRLNPDAVIVTGDLTENGILNEFERVKEYLKKIKIKNIIVLSGNHDYRNTGYLLFKKFFPSKTIHEFDDAVIITLGTARPDRDEGEVGYRQNLWLARTLSKHTNKTKIIAMHHHLISIPDTGSDRIIVLDAGDVLQSALTAKVNLVLCGHKHRPWIWNLGPLTIAYAGTTSSERMRGLFENTYNIISIDKGKVSVDLKVVNGERIPLYELVKRHAIAQLSDD